MPHTEELLQRETLSENRVFAHERRMVRLENGATAERELIRHPGGVGIVAVDENDRLLMVRQYRSGMGHESLEIPAGKRGFFYAGVFSDHPDLRGQKAGDAVPHPCLLR